MIEIGEPWQLIVSFNKAGEGTLIEPSPNWENDSGYGIYLDCLHEISLHEFKKLFRYEFKRILQSASEINY